MCEFVVDFIYVCIFVVNTHIIQKSIENGSQAETCYVMLCLCIFIYYLVTPKMVMNVKCFFFCLFIYFAVNNNYKFSSNNNNNSNKKCTESYVKKFT